MLINVFVYSYILIQQNCYQLVDSYQNHHNQRDLNEKEVAAVLVVEVDEEDVADAEVVVLAEEVEVAEEVVVLAVEEEEVVEGEETAVVVAEEVVDDGSFSYIL